jgi:hypothetical protein
MKLTNNSEIIGFIDKQLKTPDEKKQKHFTVLEKESHTPGHFWDGMRVCSRVTDCVNNIKTVTFVQCGAPFARLTIDQIKIVSIETY